MSEGNNHQVVVAPPQMEPQKKGGVFSFSLSTEGIAVGVVAAALVLIGMLHGSTLHKHEKRITALERVVIEVIAPTLHRHWWQK